MNEPRVEGRKESWVERRAVSARSCQWAPPSQHSRGQLTTGLPFQHLLTQGHLLPSASRVLLLLAGLEVLRGAAKGSMHPPGPPNPSPTRGWSSPLQLSSSEVVMVTMVLMPRFQASLSSFLWPLVCLNTYPSGRAPNSQVMNGSLEPSPSKSCRPAPSDLNLKTRYMGPRVESWCGKGV